MSSDAPSKNDPARHDAEVIVVGAGFAGLVAARELAFGGASTIVLEARDRVGGRVEGTEVDGELELQLGGQWIGPTQDRLKALAESFGAETYPTPDHGKHLLELDGKQRRYRGTIPRVGPMVLVDIALTRRKLERLSSNLTHGRPWEHPDADELDLQSLAQWLEENMRTAHGRTLIRIAGRTVWGAEPEQLSILHALFYIHSAGGFDSLFDTGGGAQQDLFVRGSHRIARLIGDAMGERLHLRSPVERIAEIDGGVEVSVAGGRQYRARRAIVSVPTSLRGEIAFDPPLPSPASEVSALAPLGETAKCFAIYESPFWREDGLSGEAVSDVGPVTLTFDCSPPQAERGVLLGFVGGSDLRYWNELSAEDRQASVLGCFERLFGELAVDPLDYLERDWGTERWTGGGPVAVMGPGAWTRLGPALSEPVGRIHWAGTETADRWAGYIDGAVRSGERAAAEALAAL